MAKLLQKKKKPRLSFYKEITESEKQMSKLNKLENGHTRTVESAERFRGILDSKQVGCQLIDFDWRTESRQAV